MPCLYADVTPDLRTLVLMEIGPIPDALWRTMTPAFHKAADHTYTAPLSWPLVVQLMGTFGTEMVRGPGLTTYLLGQVAGRTGGDPLATLHPDTLSVRRRDGVAPRDYQFAGAAVIASGTAGSALVLDEPGVGKTLTAILGVLELRHRGVLPPAAPIVVVCPPSVVDNWVTEWRSWTGLSVLAWRGEPRQRDRLAAERAADVYVCSYAIARRDCEPSRSRGPAEGPLLRLNAQVVIIDETQALKNTQSVQSKAVRTLAHRAAHVIPLSGTPITHNARDLWPTLNAMSSAAWPSGERYERRYLLSVPDEYGRTILGLDTDHEAEFRRCLLGDYRRLAKADVLTQLPPKIYSTRLVELPAAYRTVYEAMETDMLAELPDGGELPAMTVLSQLTRLNQLAAAAATVTVTKVVRDGDYGPEETDSVHVELQEPSWKVDEVEAVLAERPGQKALIFAPSRQLVELTAARLERAHYRVGRVVGGQKPAERTANVNAFQRGELDVLCLTTSAGGVGLTLTAASLVIFIQRPWSYVEASQAEDRAHRIGSEVHEAIEIVDIVARDTIESRIRAVLREKAGALAEMLQDPRIVAHVLGGVGTDAGVKSRKQKVPAA